MLKWIKLQWAMWQAYREVRAEEYERQLIHEANCSLLLNKCWETGEVWTGSYDPEGNWIMTRAKDL